MKLTALAMAANGRWYDVEGGEWKKSATTPTCPPDEQLMALRYLAKQTGLLWGGVYERGGDAELNALIGKGLVEPVAEPYTVGRTTFRGGYRITPAGRRALEVET